MRNFARQKQQKNTWVMLLLGFLLCSFTFSYIFLLLSKLTCTFKSHLNNRECLYLQYVKLIELILWKFYLKHFTCLREIIVIEIFSFLHSLVEVKNNNILSELEEILNEKDFSAPVYLIICEKYKTKKKDDDQVKCKYMWESLSLKKSHLATH